MAGLKPKTRARIAAAVNRYKGAPSPDGAQVVKPWRHLAAVTDQLHAIRRLLEKPELCTPQAMDVVVIAVGAVHSKLEAAVHDMRSKDQT